MDLSRYQYFSEGERRIDGTPIDWDRVAPGLLAHLDAVRGEIGAPIKILREYHPHREWSAIDFVSDAPAEVVVMRLLSRPVAVGIYAGKHGPSYHVDEREPPLGGMPPRWLAVHPSQESRWCALAARERIGDLESNRKPNWIYLRYSHEDAFLALLVTVQCAEETRRKLSAT